MFTSGRKYLLSVWLKCTSMSLIFREHTHLLTVWNSTKETGVIVMVMTEGSLLKSSMA